ncbi:60S ribosomal protein L28 [Coelomomyces lativittatus]|nr:60S ribosomal protein L28 [Coelomomyces lativittatus]
MRYFHLNKNKYWKPVVNVQALWSLVGESVRQEYKAHPTLVPVIDTLQAGYGKVLGKGSLPPQPLIVKAREVSALAEEKIKSVGGIVELI